MAYGGTVNPPRNRKGGAGNPPPKGARASALPDRFFGCLGSHAFCRELQEDACDAVDVAGTTLRDALREAGLEGTAIEHCEPERYVGYAEAHIEQGPWLEHQGKRIGVVTGIVGSRNLTVSAAGQQNHAGTTPMALRRDAGHALVEFAHRVYETFPQQAGERNS